MNSLCRISLLSVGLLLTCAANVSAQTSQPTTTPAAIPVDLDIDEADVQTVSHRRFSYYPSYRRLYGFGGRRGFSSFSFGFGRPFYGGYSRFGFGRFGYSRYGFGRFGFGGIGLGYGYYRPFYSASLYRLGYYGYGGLYSPYYGYNSFYRPYGGFYYRPSYSIYRPYSYLSMPYGYTYGYGAAGYPFAYRSTFSAARVYNFGAPAISTWNGCAPPCYGNYGFGCAPF